MYILTNHDLMVNKTAHMSGSIFDRSHLYQVITGIKSCINAIVEKNFSNHAVRIVIEKNNVDFHADP